MSLRDENPQTSNQLSLVAALAVDDLLSMMMYNFKKAKW